MSIQVEACKPQEEWIILITLFVSWQLGYPSFHLILNIRNKNMSCFHIKEKSLKHYVYMNMKLDFPHSSAFLSEIFGGNKQKNIGHTFILILLITVFSVSQFSELFIEVFFTTVPSFIICTFLITLYLKLNLEQLIFCHKVFMVSLYWTWFPKLNF